MKLRLPAVHCRTTRFVLALLALVLVRQGLATEIEGDRIDPAGIRGSLVLCGGGRLPDQVRDEFVKLAGGKEARLVVIPTASDDDTVQEDAAEVAEIWKARGIAGISVFHTRSHEQANDPAFVRPLKDATAVWITGGRQSQIAAAYSRTLVEEELRGVLERGGVIGGTSAGAACQSRVMIVRGVIHPTSGLGLIPGAIVDQHFLARDRKARLLAALQKHPSLVGFGIDEGTALVLRGRSLRCLGDSTVTICFGEIGRRAANDQVLKPGDVSDLTMLRRAAMARCGPPFPPVEPAAPEVPRGALVLVGGGKMPPEAAARFVELAGGSESLIVALPTGLPEPPYPDRPFETGDGPPRPLQDPGGQGVKFLERAGAKNIRWLTVRRRAEVESVEFRETLAQAKGVWFGGGRQWAFVDAYEGTQAIDLFRDVLRRGGVIGGTSAGATIQGEYLVRGSPLGNEQMMCAGYEKGFCFLPGTAIDQHFAQRKRSADMTQLVAAHPQLLGIGIDESTAIVVQGHTAEVLGKGKARFFDRRKPVDPEQPDAEQVGAGRKYDLKMRRGF